MMSYFCILSTVGNSAAQAEAAGDLVKQGPSEVPESVCQPDAKTMQQHIEKGGVTSGRGKSKMSGKRMIHAIAKLAWYKCNIQMYNSVLLLYLSQLYEIKYQSHGYHISMRNV